jgi:hypothetical protein
MATSRSTPWATSADDDPMATDSGESVTPSASQPGSDSDESVAAADAKLDTDSAESVEEPAHQPSSEPVALVKGEQPRQTVFSDLFDGAARQQRYAESPDAAAETLALPAVTPGTPGRSSRAKGGRHRWMAAGDAVALYVAETEPDTDDH